VARIVYVGDEVTAAGLRLAGVETRVATPGDAAESLRGALADGAECVLLDGALSGCVPPALLATALGADAPLFAVVPDVRGRGQPPDLARSVRNALGIEA
jgi:vacuolar-type H+-ATPase subunit F/Vma7